MAEFLLEIGLEEVPARMLAAGETELLGKVLALLRRERLLDQDEFTASFSTPRRLAVLIGGIRGAQPDTEETLVGPPVSAAFKNGVPGPAAHAFAKKAGVSVEALEQTETPKGLYLTSRVHRRGRAATEVLCALLPAEIGALSWPKSMYWRPGKPERFVRPLKWLLALLDDAVIPLEFAGVTAGRESRGHRILFGAEPVAIAHPSAYEETLREAKVLVDAQARRQLIRKALDRATRTLPGARWREDESLVETVTYLTEWPTVLLGSFSPTFLALPEEVLVTVMRDHQKYFAVEDAEGKLAPHFLTVLNTEAGPSGEATIRHGNERVLRARFNDAQFFWDFDQRIPLTDRAHMLESVTFHKDLGTYAAKTERTRGIAAALAEVVHERKVPVDRIALDMAVTLAKTDLTTELVKEFTELQGIVGGLYAGRQAEPGDARGHAAAQAVYWQYMPASVSDPVPPSIEGQLLGLADRLGTIVDLFGIGLAPTGSKDPYALRRAANALIKILAVSRLPLSLADLLLSAGGEAGVLASVRGFLEERLHFYLRDVMQFPADVVTAVLSAGSDDVPDAAARSKALAKVRGSEDFSAIAAAWKRTKNILRQAGQSSSAAYREVNVSLFREAAERELWASVTTIVPEVEQLRGRAEYQGALERIAGLRPLVDGFFDTVMVMAPEEALRNNRLALLESIVREFGRIADFSEIAPSPGAE